MSKSSSPTRSLPSRRQALVFQGKAALLQIRRLVADRRAPVARHVPGQDLHDAPILAEVSAEIWNHRSPVEFPLTAGKIQNLRVACAALHGLELPSGGIFSFWKQLGRTTTRKGYTTGRELREGCLVANVGGGLCQLSNLLYSAALEAGCEIIERHPHSRIIPGSLAEQDRDATVFWNYVDLRFRTGHPIRLETFLTATHLTVRLRACEGRPSLEPLAALEAEPGTPVRSNPSGDCLTCGMTSCFRHPSATTTHRPSSGHSAFLLDEHWPEFQGWCRKHSLEGDRWLLPLDGHRWKKANYAWSPPDTAAVSHATVRTLYNAWQTRRLPAQGAVRQRALLARDIALANHYAARLDPQARHLVVAQNLLPHLWRQGVLRGRTFDVLMTRWPLDELQRRLDRAGAKHPTSPTLTDFRADPDLVEAEREALAEAAHLVTPHRAIAAHFGARSLLLNWQLPKAADRKPEGAAGRIFFPASPLGRKGIYELAAAVRDLDVEVLVLGRATEGGRDPLASVPHRPGTVTDLLSSAALVLPAWIEHRPRLALQALANGIPVIASADCGLPDHPLLCQIGEPNQDDLHAALAKLLSANTRTAARRAS